MEDVLEEDVGDGEGTAKGSLRLAEGVFLTSLDDASGGGEGEGTTTEDGKGEEMTEGGEVTEGKVGIGGSGRGKEDEEEEELSRALCIIYLSMTERK